MNEEILLKLWAKTEPYHPLWCHLLDVAAACEALLPCFGGVENLPTSWICLIVGAHDIGKADDWFQNKNEELAGQLNDLGLNLPGKTAFSVDDQCRFRHEARSAQWFNEFLLERDWKKRGAARNIADAIHGHHGDFSSPVYTEENIDRKQMWDALRSELLRRLWSVLQPEEDFVLESFSHAGVATLKLSGLIVLSDWLASNHELWRYDELPRQSSVQEYWLATQVRACEVVASLHFVAPVNKRAELPLRFGDVWPDMQNTARPAQIALEEEVSQGVAPGLCLLEEQMGEGKTEAALYLASEWNRQLGQNGAYLALPTQATSNQMYERYKVFLKSQGQDAPRLVHGMAWLIDKSTFDDAPELGGETEDRQLALEWFRPLRRALLAPDGVGTIDQVLMAALHVKFGFLRLLGLGCKVLVIDEVHAYDDYMTAILERLLQWCGAVQIGVILLSATLSHAQKKRLVSAYHGSDVNDNELPHSRTTYPLITFCTSLEKPREIGVPPDITCERSLHLELHYGVLDDISETTKLAQELIQDGGNVCILCNTVKSAQDTFKELNSNNDKAKNTELFLFHARFRAAERNRIEREIIARFGKNAGDKRPRRSILVATQVVEQSLDVDFDFFITQIAPVDLMLQRSGRLHRHPPKTRSTNAKPVLHVLLPPSGVLDFGATGKVYEREILLRSLSYLETKRIWRLPHDFRSLIEGVYARNILPNDLIPLDVLEQAVADRDAKRQLESSKARDSLLPEPDPCHFSMARVPKGEAEGEGATGNNFRAATRIGDDSRAVLVLHESDLIELARCSLQKESFCPSQEKLKRLFENKVNLPSWWFRGVQCVTVGEKYFEGEYWLRGHLILPMKNRKWDGVDEKGRTVTIRDDKVLGLQRVVLDVPDDELEADAGLTG